MRYVLKDIRNQDEVAQCLTACVGSKLLDYSPYFTQLIAEYHNWILEKVGAPPKINGAEGNAAKQILDYLSKITEDPIVAWKFILQHFDMI